MGHLHSYRQGWQSENIAKFLLSKFSFIAKPSNVSEDIGSDFLCTLFKVEKNELYPNSSFAIQIKSKNKKKIEVTRKMGYLNNLEIPFFIGIIDREKLKLSIYAGEYLCDFFSSSEGIGINKYYIKPIEKRTEPLKMFERKGDQLSILFPKVIEVDAKYDYYKNPNEIKDLFSICRLMQENISSKTSNEFTFKRFNSNYVWIYTGMTSIKYFQDNFLKRLAEVFHNLNWALKSNKANKEAVKKQFEIYKKFYEDLKKLYGSFPEHLSKGFDELDRSLKG